MTFWRVVGKLASESYEMLRDVDKWTWLDTNAIRRCGFSLQTFFAQIRRRAPGTSATPSWRLSSWQPEITWLSNSPSAEDPLFQQLVLVWIKSVLAWTVISQRGDRYGQFHRNQENLRGLSLFCTRSELGYLPKTGMWLIAVSYR